MQAISSVQFSYSVMSDSLPPHACRTVFTRMHLPLVIRVALCLSVSVI